jgi:hypothetical protein
MRTVLYASLFVIGECLSVFLLAGLCALPVLDSLSVYSAVIAITSLKHGLVVFCLQVVMV